MTGRPILRLKTPRQPAPVTLPPRLAVVAAAPLPAAHVAPTPLRVEDILAELEPLFEPTGERMLPRYPYRIGIAEELLGDPRFKPGDDPEAAREFVRRTIARVTGTRAYLRSLGRPGAMRHDINGAPVEAVADGHREHALRQLEERERKRTAQTAPACPTGGRRPLRAAP